ncbi:MAG: sterol desaturase family protein [Sphingomonadaceae bacterium]
MSRARLDLALIISAAVAGLLVAERKRPLRHQTLPAVPRNLRNAALGAGCAVIVAAVEEPLAQAIARGNLAKGRGFAQHLPRPLRLLGGIAAMDYGFYWWHVATHRVPFLWRFHRVHHVDPDMDASTAVRFHPLDMLVSLPWRLVQVRLAGVSPKGLRYWRQFFNASILFHHSNLRLPGGWDRLLRTVLTTPEMHGLHHSQVPAQQDSNFTSGLSLWDRLHGTFRAEPPPGSFLIGVDDPQAIADVPLGQALTAPLRPTNDR